MPDCHREVWTISIHPPCGGRDIKAAVSGGFYYISIHPPCGGRDHKHVLPPREGLVISIHPPCGGRDRVTVFCATPTMHFNPPALWGAGPFRQWKSV